MCYGLCNNTISVEISCGQTQGCVGIETWPVGRRGSPNHSSIWLHSSSTSGHVYTNSHSSPKDACWGHVGIETSPVRRRGPSDRSSNHSSILLPGSSTTYPVSTTSLFLVDICYGRVFSSFSTISVSWPPSTNTNKIEMEEPKNVGSRLSKLNILVLSFWLSLLLHCLKPSASCTLW